jgi:nucleotide-binding universal stress UspA family protein
MMYTKILVPLDGSQLAEGVLPYARSLANGLKLHVELLHINDPETVAPAIHFKREGDYLKDVATSFLPSLTVRCRVESGQAAEVIVDAASRDAGTLIAMATHGRSGARRWLLGQVTQKVLRVTVNPLLVIRPTGSGRPSGEVRLNSVILPLDGSRLAEKALPHIVYLATRLPLEVVLIRSYALPTAGYFVAAGTGIPALEELGEKLKGEASNYLRAQAANLQAQGVAKVSWIVREGKGAEEIIDLARKTSGNMVAMSTHGRSGIGRWVLGSVADRVVSYCGEPVLLIRPTTS